MKRYQSVAPPKLGCNGVRYPDDCVLYEFYVDL